MGSATSKQCAWEGRERILPATEASQLMKASGRAQEFMPYPSAMVARLELLDSLEEAARTSGEAAGYQIAYQELSEFYRKLRELSKNQHDQLIHLVLLALRRVIGEMPPDVLIAGIAEQTVGSLATEKGFITVFVNPAHVDAVHTRLTNPAEPNGLATSIQVSGDRTFGEYDCRVETEFAVIDASLEVQLVALERAFASSKTD